MSSSRDAERLLCWILGGVIALLAAGALAWWLPASTVSIQLQGQGDYQVFFDRGAGLNEADSRRVRVDGSAATSVKLTGLPAGISSLRIDPSADSNGVTVCAVSLQLEALPGLVVAEDGGSQAATAHELQLASGGGQGCQRWVVTEGASDPQISVGFNSPSSSAKAARQLRRLAWLLLALAAGLLVLAASALPKETSLKLKCTANRAYEWLDKKLVVIFLVLASLLGTGYALLTPPGSVPDELSHAGKVARIAIGDWVGADESGPFPPVEAWYGPFVGFLHHPRKYSMSELRAVAVHPLQCARTERANHDAAAGAAPVPYVVPSAVYSLTCARHGSFGAFLYVSRLLNLAVYLVLVAVGLKYAEFGRWALFAVALLPMSLYLAASISYDSPALAGTFCLLGIVSGVYSRRITCKGAAVPIFLLSLFLVFQKPLTGWVFMLPAIALGRCREERYSLLAWSSLTMVVPALMHAAWVLVSISMAGDRPDVAAVNGFDSLLQQPLRFVEVLVATYTSSIGLFVAKGILGIFGWLDVYLPAMGYWSACGALVLAGLIGREKRLETRARVFVVGAALVAFIATNLPFYAFWTEPASMLIQGLQGRYFLPMAAAVAMTIPSGVRGWVRPLAAVSCICLLAVSSLLAYSAMQERYFHAG